MTRLGRLLAICLLALTGTAAQAQETGTLLQHKAAQVRDRRSPGAARLVLEDFAACLLSRSPGRVSKMLATPLDTREYRQQFSALFESINDECLSGGDLGLSTGLLRGALFQAVYDREFGKKGPTSYASDLDTGYAATFGPNPSPEAISAIAMAQFGECIARADPAGVRQLLIATSASPSEKLAFANVAPRIGACLPQGQQFTLSRASVKGVLAESLYRLSVAASAKDGAK